MPLMCAAPSRVVYRIEAEGDHCRLTIEHYGLSEGAVARFGDGRGTAALPVRIDSAVPRGAVWVESCHDATAPLAPAGALTVTRA